MNILIVTYGFLGDILFSSAIADYFHKKGNEVDMMIGFPQPLLLLKNNPNIRNVYTSHITGPTCVYNSDLEKNYDKVIKLSQLSFKMPPVVEYKKQSGILDDESANYDIYTDSNLDKFYYDQINNIKKELGRPVVAVLANWEERSFLFTKEEYYIGIDVPNLGYGGKRRNIDKILDSLRNHVFVIPVGFKSGTNSIEISKNISNPQQDILEAASILKNCDYFIGAENGLYNLACGVGTKTIITGDFLAQLYGPNGCIKKLKVPYLGAWWYKPHIKHTMLDPFLTDDEVIEQILYYINHPNETYIFDWNTL